MRCGRFRNRPRQPVPGKAPEKHFVKAGVNLVTIRDLLGHMCITSTQVYLHTTAEDLRSAAMKHPVESLINRIEDLLPCGKIPFQWAPGERRIASG